MRVEIVTPPAVEPVSLTEAKKHARIEIDADDVLVTPLITAAREKCETELGQALINTTFDLFLDQWPHDDLMRLRRELVFPRAPLVSVTSVSYYDSTNTLQTLDPSLYDVSPGFPGRLWRSFGQAWPVLASKPDAVVIRFIAGYGATAADVPQIIKQALLLLLAHWYENRETTVIGTSASDLPWAVQSLLTSASHGRYA